MNICYATFNWLPDLRPYKTGPREEEGSESKDLYVKYACDLSKSRRRFQCTEQTYPQLQITTPYLCHVCKTNMIYKIINKNISVFRQLQTVNKDKFWF